MRWKASGDTQYRGYHFTYDDQNRLSEAIYVEGSGSITNNEKYSVYFSYDNMGNLTELMRKGLSNGAYTFIDDLELDYIGNQLICVEDNAIDPSYYGAFNFVGNSLSGAYEYDKNGNLTKDLNKNILSIEYNCLNLPQTISFPYMDNFCYTYDAEGRKLHTEQSVTTLTPLPISTMISTDYCDNFVYSLHNQIKILFDGGYITLDEDIPTYHFYLQDHLGSNRVVINQNGTVEQVNHYYPFGGLMGDICVNQETQFYKYNGKELDRTHGLDWYDYGARHYDAVLSRWHTMDPLCEKYYDVSPYAYSHNSPIRMIDPDGQAPGDFFLSMKDAAIDFGLLFNAISIFYNREFNSYILKVINDAGVAGFTYTIPAVGTKNTSIPSEECWGDEKVAFVHTHGAYDEDFYNNEFSGVRIGRETLYTTDQRMTEKGITDVGIANRESIFAYVVTPNGSLQEYNPKTGKITVISNNMPSDPNDPQRLNVYDAPPNTSWVIDYYKYKLNINLFKHNK